MSSKQTQEVSCVESVYVKKQGGGKREGWEDDEE